MVVYCTTNAVKHVHFAFSKNIPTNLWDHILPWLDDVFLHYSIVSRLINCTVQFFSIGNRFFFFFSDCVLVDVLFLSDPFVVEAAFLPLTESNMTKSDTKNCWTYRRSPPIRLSTIHLRTVFGRRKEFYLRQKILNVFIFL